MKNTNIKNELQNIISKKSSNGNTSLVQTVANYLRSGERASPMAEKKLKFKYQNKKEETKRLIKFAEQHNLHIQEIDETKFVSSGAEQRVYIHDNQFVIKLNDSIYYASWDSIKIIFIIYC